jgi:succinylglutamate desuccinylase
MAVIEGKKYSPKELLRRIQNCERPLVYVNACTHGNERVGYDIIESLKSVSLLRGTLLTNIANKKAFDQNVRFIDHDLNRIFPGNPKGSFEERLACELLPIIQAADIVIDIHSTETGVDSSLMVTRINKKTAALVQSINPRRVLVMSETKNNALISNANIGIGFEYGKDRNQSTFDRTLRDILVILKTMGMIKKSIRKRRGSTECYKVIGSVDKYPGSIVAKNIRNFRMVKKGDVIGTGEKNETRAKRDFYPILFGKNTYQKIFGFMGEKIDL